MICSTALVQLVLTVGFFCPKFTYASGPDLPKIYFSEIMGEGSSASTDDKWIELYNSSSEIVELSGWSVFDEVKKAKGSKKAEIKITDGLIAPGGYFLIARGEKNHKFKSGEEEKQSVLNIDPDVVDSNVSWDKLHFQLSLRDKTGTAIDWAGSGGKLPQGIGHNPKRSIKRVAFEGGVSEGDWTLSTDTEIKNLDECTEENYNDCVLDFAFPENSGRPKIESVSVAKNKFAKNQDFALDLEYSVNDSKGDLDRIVVEILSGEKVAEKTESEFGKNHFVFGPGNFDKARISFFDQTGLWSSKDFDLIFYQKSNQVKFSEVLPHPRNRDWNSDGKVDTNDEWIELVNLGAGDIDLSGWEIRDKAGKIFKLDGKIIEHGSFLLIYNLKPIIINDSGEELLLVGPEGETADSVKVPSSSSPSKEDAAYAREGDSWCWTKTPTPGGANKIIGFEETADIGEAGEAQTAVLEEEDIADDTSEETAKIILITTVKRADLSNIPTEIPKIDSYVLGTQAQNNSVGAFLESKYLLYLASAGMLFSIIFIYEFSRRQR